MAKAEIFDVYHVNNASTYVIPSGTTSLASWQDFCPVFEKGYRLVETDDFGHVRATVPLLDAEERESILWAFHNRGIHKGKSILAKKLKIE